MAAEPRRAGVIGHPVAHSRSPAMHAAAYAELGMDWEYVRVDVRPDSLGAFVSSMPAAGFAGVNVTIPHKQAVIELCSEIGPEAAAAGSVNTLLVREGAIHGESTDGRGLLWALGDVEPADALVLGAGGAARAAVAALRQAGWEVAVSARRPEAAAELGEAVPWPPERAAALVVNATPLGQRETPLPGTNDSLPIATPLGQRETPLPGTNDSLPIAPGLIEPGAIVVDLAYRGDGAETPLCEAARERGARVVDGIEVLIGQGIYAFELLTGRRAPVEAMRRGARA
jgi:shikimate dehydrogenase